MTNDAIFLVSDSGQLQRVEHQLYATEDVLQELVAKHPELLAGDQIDPSAPPRWLLIRREATIPDSAGGADRWWLDHLLLDQFGIPTLVEVKRSTDTRIRREVVGQMLDYVANAQAYWAAGRMRQMLIDEMGSLDVAERRLADYLGASGEPEAVANQLADYWNRVEANMREGNVRLLFVADALPRELKRLIEFLNEQFTKIEVLGIELRQYVGQGIKALVPRVVGQTEAARDQKVRSSGGTRSSGSSRSITEKEFLEKCDPEIQAFFTQVLDDARARQMNISWGMSGFSVSAPGHLVFFKCYPPGGCGRVLASIELTPDRDPKFAEEMREEFSKVPDVEPGGRTLVLQFTSASLVPARQIAQMSFDYMERQRRAP